MIDRLLLSVVVDDVFAGFFVSVPPGYVGCIYDRGRGVLNKVLKPGLHLKLPVWQKAKLFNVQTLEYTLRSNFNAEGGRRLGGDAAVATSADLEKVVIESSILFKLDEKRIPEIWQSVGENFIEKVIEPVVRNRISAVVGQFESKEIFSKNRQELDDIITKSLESAFDSRGIILEDFVLGSITKYTEPSAKEGEPKKDQDREEYLSDALSKIADALKKK
jgi:regulator of protease activity HflC (stomatin/prohibitin superfamily)